MTQTPIHSLSAPQAIGPYSQAIRAGELIFFSGQIPLDPASMSLVTGDIEPQTRRVFDNLQAVAQAAGGDLSDLVKVNIFLLDLENFATVNQIMGEYFSQPYPARACVGVSALPMGALVEIEAVMLAPRGSS